MASTPTHVPGSLAGEPAVSDGLTQEELLLQSTTRDFAARELAPTAIERDEAERYDRSLFAKMGELGLTAAPLPESVGGSGFSYLGWTLVMEELGAVDMSMAVSLSVHLLSQYPVVDLGHARAAGALAAGHGERRGARRVRPDRAARGQRRGGDPDARGTGRAGRRAGRLPADRHEDLDLQRTRGGALPRVRDARPDGRRQGDHRVPRREGDGRVPVRRARTEDGDPRLPGDRAGLRPRRDTGREPAGRGRGGLQDRAVGARGGADLDRGGVRRDRPGRAAGGGALRRRSAARSAARCPSSRGCGSCWPRWPARSRPRGP